ncbi:phosphatidate cytidylyltransferase [Mechercharimyces sp. CAU 1602]|uniref:phosphatidate cytidylyltransferase n=1 Tax=Mechercharimyces sp. CAU 1602 TaxID=2973933 RepID=UPI0021615F9F|nr:phosphatidate cytidylyltransferase [Mechercharimyces sp. CAU 1602]MCS1351299.1 phosphatidate cytidylyltransferase [Mechercharimyces sp. CAU 1602]
MKQRTITGFIVAAGFMGFLLVGGVWYAGLIAVIALIGYKEFNHMLRISWYKPQALFGFFLVALFQLYTMVGAGGYFSLERILFPSQGTIVLLGVIGYFLIMIFSKNEVDIHHVSLSFIGAVYIGFGFSYMIEGRLIEEGLYWSLLVIFVTWANDIGAYMIGRRLGKRKLWPTISPNKTMGGHLGGLIAAIVVGGIFIALYPILGTVTQMMGVIMMIAVFGQLGDLAESAMKRTFSVKDSGTLLPGHGGVLDRMDSLIFVFPVLHLLQVI